MNGIDLTRKEKSLGDFIVSQAFVLEEKMYKESAGKLFIKYAIPQMIGLLFNSVYVIVDGIFIGNRIGSTALAAAGIAVLHHGI